MAARGEVADQPKAAEIGRQLDLAHPVMRLLDAEEIPLDAGAALQQGLDARAVGIGAIHVAEDHAGEIGAFAGQDVEDLAAAPADAGPDAR